MNSNFLRLLSLVALMVTHNGLATEPEASDNNIVVPEDAVMAQQANAATLIYGQQLISSTRKLLPDNVGASLDCSSCHLNEGRKPDGLSFINTDAYPSYSARIGKVIDLADRINNCFERSMNGSPLPKDGREMQAMVAYMSWISQSVPAAEKAQIKLSQPIDKTLVADMANGRQIYVSQCSECHNMQGKGKFDSGGNVIFPALWGDNSFNVGAGMARTYTAAAFVYSNMPLGVDAHQSLGKLTEQQAVDVAAYFTHMPRPDFADKMADWPKGDKPVDARY